MKILELFAGTCSVGRAFEKRGHQLFSVDWDKKFQNISLYTDISTLTAEKILQEFGQPDIIWASPDCTTYSVAGIHHHRTKNKNGELIPISEYAKMCDKTNIHMLELIKELNPKLFFIENPRAGLRKMSFMQGIPRYTITYCQYGDKRMKPTDIWTNYPNPNFKPPCHNGDPCHERAPRGSSSGTQGIKTVIDKARIPEQFCEYIVDICEDYLKPGD